MWSPTPLGTYAWEWVLLMSSTLTFYIIDTSLGRNTLFQYWSLSTTTIWIPVTGFHITKWHCKTGPGASSSISVDGPGWGAMETTRWGLWARLVPLSNTNSAPHSLQHGTWLYAVSIWSYRDIWSLAICFQDWAWPNDSCPKGMSYLKQCHKVSNTASCVSCLSITQSGKHEAPFSHTPPCSMQGPHVH